MRTDLWPEAPEDHRTETATFFAQKSPTLEVFVADRENGRLGGFLECGTRSYAEGCVSSPVPYIEGWWVDPDLRREGVGGLLVSAVEGWARSQGHTEMASDASLDNEGSRLAHQALGYQETHRIVCYRKKL